MSEPTINIKFYRVVMGIRTPYIMVLNGRRELISETVDHDALARSASRAPLMAAEGGGAFITPVVTKPSDAWFAEGAPNPLPGTEDLRTSYFDQVKALQDEHEKAGTKCPDCELGSILRQFKVSLKELGHDV